LTGSEGSGRYTFGNWGLTFGTYGNQGVKPLLPSLPGGGEGRHHEYIPFQPGAPGWADFGTSGSFGTYGNQGAKPLGPILPPLPGGGVNPYLAAENLETDEDLYDIPLHTSSYGTYGNQGIKPLVPISLTVYDGLGHQSSDTVVITVSDTTGPVFVLTETGHTSPCDTYGNQGVKPLLSLLPSLPGGGESFATCVHSGICGKQGNAGVDTGWTDPSGGGGDSRETIIAIIDAAEVASVLHPELSDEPMAEDEDADVSLPEKGSASKLNLFSGEVCESAVDLHIASRGPDFVWGRIYRSRTGDDTTIGSNWNHSCNIYIEPYGSSIIVRDSTGRKDLYHPSEPNTWTADGFFRELAQEDDESFTLTFAHKGTWSFLALNHPNAPGKISAITDRNGNALTFDYDSLGRLITIHDTLDTPGNSREIAIAYNGSGLIESVTDWAERQVKYEYYAIGDPNGSVGDLKSVTTPEVRGTPTGNDFPEGKTTTYTYSRGFADDRLNHNLLTITNPKGQTYLQNTYGTDPNDPNFDHVVRQILGNPNDVIDITYAQVDPDANNNYAVTKTVTNDRVGNVTKRLYDNRNRLVILRRYTGRAEPNLPTSTDPNVNMPANKLRPDDPNYFETCFQYNSEHLLTRVDYPNGNHVTYVYEFDLDSNAPIRSCGNLREIRRFAGSLEPISDQNEIIHSFEYDPNTNNGTNFLTRYTDPCGQETHMVYDENGNLTESTATWDYPDPDRDIVYEWQYNEHGQLTASILPDNGSGSRRRDEYIYYAEPDDPNCGYLKNVIVDTNNLDLTTAYRYDDVGNVTRITDPCGHDTQYAVNQINQVVRRTSREVTDSSGIRYQRDYYFDENNNIVQIDVQNKNEHGELQLNTHFTTAFEYDILNYLIRATREVDTTKTVRTEFEYDGNRNLTLIRSGEAVNGSEPNNSIRYLYDERNLLFQTIRAEDDPNQSTTQYDYDGNGNLKKVSQGLGSPPHISSFEYDGFNRIIEANDPMGNLAEYHYDSAGNLVVKRIEGELVDNPNDTNNVRLYESSYEYDTLNRLTRLEVSHFDPNTQSPIGDGNMVTHFYYNDNSQLTRVVNDNGHETRCQYDTANRLSLVTDAKENTVAYSYDENSNITARTAVEESDLDEPNDTFVTTYEYDDLDRLIRVIDSNDNTTDFAYDSRSNCTRITNALNNESRYEYDGLNRLVRAVRDMDGDGADPGDANDIVTSRSWDDNSRLVTQTDDNGNTTAYEYDALNRRTKTTYADATNRQFVYDVHHNVVQTTDAVGSVVNCTYDLLNRLTAKTITPGPGVSNDTTFEDYKYDGLSRLVCAEDNDSLVTRSHDSGSNVTSETLNSETTTSVYDGLGNELACTYPGGRDITCTYDELNRKKVIAADGTGISTYSYIGPGRVRRCEYGNGTQCDYSHDSVKRIIGTTHSVGITIIDERTYSWDRKLPAYLIPAHIRWIQILRNRRTFR
jgi:YD repeat-containing protein